MQITHIDARTQLNDTRGALSDLHQTLLNGARLDFEKVHGRVNSGELLRLTLEDARFAWLRPMSRLIAEIDGSLADPAATVGTQTLARYRRTIERGIAGAWQGFGGNYLVLLQSEPALVVAHGALRRQLAALPQAVKNVFVLQREMAS